GPAREASYKHFVDAMVKGLEPPIRNLVEGQFREGILIRKEGTDDKSKELVDELIPLLRKTIQDAFPQSRWDELIFLTNQNPYRSKVTGASCAPSEEDIKRDDEGLAKVVAAWPEINKAYPAKRADAIAVELNQALERVANGIMPRLVVN